MGHVSIRRNSQTIMENQMTYPVEAEDIIDSVPQVKDAIFAVYNHGFMEGVKEGTRLALEAINKPWEKQK